MKLCDRCSVPGCCLDYLGKACENARRQTCPNVRPNRAEILTNMDIDELTTRLVPMVMELCEDGVPSPELTKMWLLGEPGEGEEW